MDPPLYPRLKLVEESEKKAFDVEFGSNYFSLIVDGLYVGYDDDKVKITNEKPLVSWNLEYGKGGGSVRYCFGLPHISNYWAVASDEAGTFINLEYQKVPPTPTWTFEEVKTD
ncbi:hypothetical protein OPQ81_005241 [Rhizoctonia solani]|nr:hypothetical protein OPQ81_005241 [Rhizoctonia solani]